MARLEGRSSAVINAPIEHVFGVAADSELGPSWQPSLKGVQVLEWDNEGRHSLVLHEIEGRLRTLSVQARFDYDAPFSMRWTQEKGDFSGLIGCWWFDDLGGSTRASCEMTIDIGGMMGLALRGPALGILRQQLVADIPTRLKRFIENNS